MLAALAILPIGATVALTACSSDDGSDSADSGPCATSSSAERENVRPINVPTSEVSVLNPGTGERAALAPKPSIASPQQVTLTTNSIESSIAPGEQNRQQVQKTEQNLTTPITARVVCDDPSDLEFTIGAPTTKDEALAPELEALDGSAGGITFGEGLDPRSLRLFPDEDSGSPARSALEQSVTGALDKSVPLPTEPVGTGATWKAERVVQAAATVTQTMTVTLESRVGNVLQLGVRLEQTPTSSVFRIPGSAQTLRIARYSMAGEGDVTVDLTKLLPTAGRITSKGARELVGDDPGAPLLQQNEFTVAWGGGDE